MKFILAYYYYCTVLANLLSTSFYVGITALKIDNRHSNQQTIESVAYRNSDRPVRYQSALHADAKLLNKFACIACHGRYEIWPLCEQ